MVAERAPTQPLSFEVQRISPNLEFQDEITKCTPHKELLMTPPFEIVMSSTCSEE